MCDFDLLGLSKILRACGCVNKFPFTQQMHVHQRHKRLEERRPSQRRRWHGNQKTSLSCEPSLQQTASFQSRAGLMVVALPQYRKTADVTIHTVVPHLIVVSAIASKLIQFGLHVGGHTGPG